MINVHLYKADSKCKYSLMTFRECVQLPLYKDGISDRIDTQIMYKTNEFLLNLRLWKMGENRTLEQSRKIWETYFQIDAQKDPIKAPCVTSMIFY